jgi:hypothetical protein
MKSAFPPAARIRQSPFTAFHVAAHNRDMNARLRQFVGYRAADYFRNPHSRASATRRSISSRER